MGTGLHGKTRVRDAAEKRGYRSRGGDSPVGAGEERIRKRGEEWVMRRGEKEKEWREI